MGLSCATQLGNIYLSGLDALVVRSFSDSIWFYKRYIDDILIAHRQAFSTDSLRGCFDSFQGCVNVTVEQSGSEVHYLDLQIKFNRISDAVSISTYRKPQCLFQYTPWNSDCPGAVKRALVVGELTRLLRTNSFECTFQSQVRLFFSHLRRLGYPQSFLSRCLAERNFSSLAVVKSPDTRKVVPFSLRYFLLIERRRETSLHRYRHAIH